VANRPAPALAVSEAERATLRGVFFSDQARSLARHGLRTGLAFVERRSLSRLSPFALLESHFQIVSRVEDQIPTVRMKGWSTFAQTTKKRFVSRALPGPTSRGSEARRR